jgi:hypothetical protein
MGSREYFIFSNNNIAFNETPTELPPTITMSLLAIPYTTHNDSPTIKAIIRSTETSSIFLVFIPLTIWGTVLETANIVARMPISGISILIMSIDHVR